jgi:protein-S-isoprenylcysteine O-methyltransferase Ste14
MTDTIFKVLYLVGLAAGWLLRKPHFRRLRRQGVTVISDFRAPEYMTPVEKLLAILGFIGILVIPVIYIFAPWLDFADYHLPTWVGAVGAATFAAGLWLQWRGRADLGHNLRPTAIPTGVTNEGQPLVTDGAYRYIRHPVYAGHWLRAIAQALLLHNWIAGLAGLVLILPMYLYRVWREEQNMLERFGEEYRLYMDRTGRVIPRLWS